MRSANTSDASPRARSDVMVVATHGSDTTRLMQVADCASACATNVQHVGSALLQNERYGAVVMRYDPVVDAAHDTARRVNTAIQCGMDAIVVYDRHSRPWRRVLVPYTYGAHDPAAFAVARRLARRAEADLMLLHVDEPDSHAVPATVRPIDGFLVRIVRGGDPVALAECEAASGHDVVVVGGGTPHPDHYFTSRLHGLISRTRASLVIVHAAGEHAPFDPAWFRSDHQHVRVSSRK